MSVSEDQFHLDEQATIVLPANAAENDLFLARLLINELSDRYDLHLGMQRDNNLPAKKRAILMGSIRNPLVAEYCARHQIEVTAQSPGPEGYVLRVDKDVVVVAGRDDRGAFYGLQSLRQLIERGEAGLRFHGARVRDWPDKPFRGIKLYLPGRNNIPFFKRFIRDFMALYKYNTLIIEMNACMRLDRHPELNSGWLEFARDANYARRNYPAGPPHELRQNSSHQDTADGGFLEKHEVADLLRFVRRHHIEVVPEIPSLTHSYYLLSRHRDLSEVPDEKWPDTYCPSNPKSYELLFDVFDEYIEVMKPRMIHVGHDELFAPIGLCPRCKGKDIGELFGQDLAKNHQYLSRRGIRMAIWGDMLLQEVRGKEPEKNKTPAGWTYYSAGGMTPEQVERLVPKDILIFNWFWSEGNAEISEARLHQMGFKQIYGNFTPEIENYEKRSKRSTLIGGAPSSWAATNEFNFGKNLVADFLGCGSILWSGKTIDGNGLSGIVQSMLPEIRQRLRGEAPPSETEASVVPVDIAAHFNMGIVEPTLAVDLRGMSSGRVSHGKQIFDLAARDGRIAVIAGAEGADKNPLPREVTGIKVGQDATSLIFLHACAKAATNKHPYRLLWDTEDSADLLGWYEVVYEDGLIATIPIRYGVNILQWDWDKRQSASNYCYAADAISGGGNNQITFFAFEWTNPRLGKAIKEIRLKGSTGFRGADPGWTDDFGPLIPNNAVILKALSLVKRRN